MPHEPNLPADTSHLIISGNVGTQNIGIAKAGLEIQGRTFTDYFLILKPGYLEDRS